MKINLKNVKDALSRDEMRLVSGGSGCCAVSHSNDLWISCGVSKSQAISIASGPSGGNWCCSSCGSASWMA